MMKINTERQDRRVHKTTINEPELLTMVAKAVALQLGIVLDTDGITYRAYTSSYQEGSLGTSKTCIVVEMTEDFSKMPKAA